MKTILRSLAAALLAVLARAILRKYQPQVVMVTGSVGKTSTKDAVAAALSERFFLRASDKSYNSEFGVPLTIIGAKTPWSDPLAWLAVFKEAFSLILLPSHYPFLLVLEVGADRPGDLAKILRIATPDAVVVTRLPEVPVHVEAYASPAAVRDEEFQPAYALPSGAPLIISSRDAFALEMAKRTDAHVRTVGFLSEADVHIGEPTLVFADGFPAGMEAPVTSGGKVYTLRAPGALGRPQILAPAAGFATALALGTSPSDALAGLAAYQPPPGRGSLLRGQKGSILIDETYNSSPAAVEEALAALSLFPKGVRRIVVLGDMLELGRYSVEEHARIGRLAASRADLLVTVGIRARAMREAALSAGMREDSLHSSDTALDAADILAEIVGDGDVVLLKGSQSMRMERAVERLLAEPEDREMLVRQDREWKRR